MRDIYDFHGHFLPGMDDGSRSVEESLKMLQMAKDQGVTKMFATPHYYPTESVEVFLERRTECWERLFKAMAKDPKKYPQVALGAEVAYRQGIGNADDLERLCLGNSRYLLLELPFVPWDGMLFRDISTMANVRGIIPVIAHVERYLSLQSAKMLDRLWEQDVLFQMNAEAFVPWYKRGKAKKMLTEGTVQLLGSDCHNLTSRKPNLGQAIAYLEKNKLYGVLENMEQLGEEIFH